MTFVVLILPLGQHHLFFSRFSYLLAYLELSSLKKMVIIAENETMECSFMAKEGGGVLLWTLFMVKGRGRRERVSDGRRTMGRLSNHKCRRHINPNSRYLGSGLWVVRSCLKFWREIAR